MKNLEIVLSILGGSVIIAAGLYFGLRARAAAPTEATHSSPAAPRPGQPPPAHAAPEAPGAVGTPGVPPGDPGEHQRVERAVNAQLLALKPALVERCWRPSAAKAPEPKKVRLSWNGTIGPSGTPLAWGLSQNREAYRSDISQCLQRELAVLKIPDPPSNSTLVTVEFELP